MDANEFKVKWDARLRDLMENGPHAYLVLEPSEKPIDWRKVAVHLRVEAENLKTGLRHFTTDTSERAAEHAAVITFIGLAAAIEDGLS